MTLAVTAGIEILIELVQAFFQAVTDTMIMAIDCTFLASHTAAYVLLTPFLSIQRHFAIAGTE